MQVYKYMDIGTAKPGEEIRKRIPHHCIDILKPSEQYTVGNFVQKCDDLIPEIIKRGRIPVISGGTGFYIKTFLSGLPETPPKNPKVRQKVFKDLETKGIDVLFQELCEKDPVAGEKIRKNDIYRVTRAVEVIRDTGRPLSSFTAGNSLRKRYRCCLLGLSRDREELYSRINRRVEQMFDSGLPDEVSGLINMGFTAEDPGMKGIGYREFFEMEIAGCLQYKDVLEKIQQNTRRYAKRQITFFKNIPHVQWHSPDDLKGIQTCISNFLGGEI